MKRKLLGYRINGVEELEGFYISLIANENKTEYDKQNNLIKVFEENENIYVNRLNLFHGLNASGKTNVLQMTNTIELFLTHINEIENIFHFFSNEKNGNAIELISYIAIENFIFEHKLNFKISNELNKEAEVISNAKIKSEKISIYDIRKNKKFSSSELEGIISGSTTVNIFEEFYDSSKSNENDLFADKILSSSKKFHKIKFLEYSLKKMFDIYSKENKTQAEFDAKTDMLFNLIDGTDYDYVIPHELPGHRIIRTILEEKNKKALDFINTFDKSIKSVGYNSESNIYKITFTNGNVINRNSLSGILSSGTIRGMVLLALVDDHLAIGSDVYIDELETNFNSRIISYIIQLFQDNKTNKKGSRLFATTHFSDTLNSTSRRDGIYLVMRDQQKQSIHRLSKIPELIEFKSRRTYTNSKLISKIESLKLMPNMKDEFLFKEKFL